MHKDGTEIVSIVFGAKTVTAVHCMWQHLTVPGSGQPKWRHVGRAVVSKEYASQLCTTAAGNAACRQTGENFKYTAGFVSMGMPSLGGAPACTHGLQM